MPAHDQAIEKIGGVENKKNVTAVEPSEDLARVAPDKAQFDSLVNSTSKVDQTGSISATQESTSVNKMSVTDAARTTTSKVGPVGAPTAKDLAVQSKDVVTKMEAAKEKLSTPGLSLSKSTQNILKNKLVHVDENLRSAMSKAGMEYNPGSTPITAPIGKHVNPIEHFVGFLTNSQAQLSNFTAELDHKPGAGFSPVDMMKLQLKMNSMTQQIEFFSSVLNKALESLKTVMNIQV